MVIRITLLLKIQSEIDKLPAEYTCTIHYAFSTIFISFSKCIEDRNLYVVLALRLLHLGGDLYSRGGGGGLGVNHARMCVSKSEGNGFFYGFK